MSATFVEARPIDSDWIGWLRHELAPTRARNIRTAIIVAGAVLCVIISMTLQVPQLATSAYMVFFASKETKLLTKNTGLGGIIALTIGIGATLLLYKFTYGHPELRIPGMAIALFLGMWLSRVLVMGPLGFLFGFVVAVSQSVGEEVSSPELLVRGLLWLWVALAYAIALTVVLNLLFLPDTPKTVARPKPKSEPDGRSLFVPDAFTNPAHVHFAFKVTFAAMFCYIVYEAIDWSGIHTAFITCTFIALESTEATFYKGTLRIVGCVIGGTLALFTIVFLMPHMDTIASLIVVVACVAAIAGWVATGTELISYAGLQMAFAFFYSVFQGYAPDTDLDNVRNRVVGILFGLVVTGLVFRYIWPERTIDRLRAALRQALRQLAQLLEIPRPESSIEAAKAKAHRLIGETAKSFDQARRYVELTQFESEESSATDQVSTSKLENILVRADEIFASAKSLVLGDGRQDQTRTALLSEITAETEKLG
ncbi:MAG: hypothetical protein DME59_19325 [Verrucomicrobia bacterium]|nr:MAG: hypothetical protein DME59_19325 [Verrucomicrobiota bacterium]